MKKSMVCSIYLFIVFITFCQNSLAIVGPVIPGQSLWCINKRIASEVDNLESKLDHLCHATMITGPTTITMEGAYCLGNTINGAITIAASHVDLDLSNRRVTQGITVNSGLNQVTIHNGTVQGGSDAIAVNGGSQNITIEEVTVKNGIRGISLTGVTDAWITNCEMVLNTTGLELNACHKVVVTDCVAGDNMRAGFSLVSTTTCTFENCKALSTGINNTGVVNTNVFGFVASNGYGNIFERCIANSTQAFTTTDANSLIAGFALRGTESGTKIIDSEAANSTTGLSGLTIPYGILLEARFDSFTSVTAVTLDMPNTVILSSVDWSPDGQYIAVGGAMSKYTGNDLRIYKFDRLTNVLTEVTSVNPDGISTDDQIITQWSPDGKYLAVSGALDGTTNDKGLFVYRFDRQSEMLVLVNAVNPHGLLPQNELEAIAWSPDGKYLAGGGDITGGGQLVLFKFDRVAETMTQVFSLAPGGDQSAGVASLDWSPDGLYLAVGAAQDNASGNDLFVYKFDRSAQTLTQVVNINPDAGGSNDIIRAVEWSPSGIYLAVGGVINGVTNNDLFIYRFNRSNETLSEVDSVNPDSGSASDQIFAVSWSPDGTALAVGGLISGTTNNDLFVYKFNRNNEKLTEFASLNPNGGSSVDFVGSLDWSPDGQYLAFLSLTSDTSLNNLFIFRTFQFPFKNVIKNNTVYNNSGGSGPQGIGISGSSICNLIVGNSAYSNPINPSIIDTSYQFVCNVFNQLFGSTPSDLQNIAIGTCDPIFNPDDVTLLVKQNINRTIDIQSKIDNLSLCAPIPLTNESITSLGPDTITIDEPGCYCLSADLAVDIVITVSCVCVDLMERCLKGTITVQTADDVVVKNGFVNAPAPTSDGSSAITIALTTNGVTLDKLMVDCANTTAVSLSGRVGISTAGNDTQILNCTVKSGSASTIAGGGVGAIGGNGISVLEDANRTLIKNCVILATGNGSPGAAGTNGGRAGHGIAVGFTGVPAFTEVLECIVFSTGNGGNGGTGMTTGGDGGHAVHVGANAVDTSVRNCTLRNTGSGGTGGSASGINGRAVNDLQTTAASFSMIFSNFAHNIANATVKYNIQNTGVESGILTPNPPTSTVVNPLANVYAS